MFWPGKRYGVCLSVLVIMIAPATIAISAAIGLWGGPKARFECIRSGMTEGEVAALLGSDGTVVSDGYMMVVGQVVVFSPPPKVPPYRKRWRVENVSCYVRFDQNGLVEYKNWIDHRPSFLEQMRAFISPRASNSPPLQNVIFLPDDFE